MEIHQKIEELTKLLRSIQNNHSLRIEELEFKIDDLDALLQQQENHIRNLRNEG